MFTRRGSTGCLEGTTVQGRSLPCSTCMGRTSSPKIRACHSLYMEDNMNRTKDLKWKCCDELNLPYSKEKRDSISKYDHTFQIAFCHGEVWDLQEKVFDMWLKFDTLGQKKQQSPSKPKGVKVKSAKSVKPLKKTSGDLNLRNWRASPAG